MNKKRRMKNRRTAEWLRRSNPPKHRCINCGELTHDGHFIPPGFGDEGFFICKRKEES